MKIPRHVVFKIDALELIRMTNRDHLADLPESKTPRYLLDLSSPFLLHSSTVASQETLPDNALFNQILMLQEEFGNIQDESPEDFLLSSILLVDFSGVFTSFRSLDSAEKAIDKIRKTPEPFSREDHLCRLLNPHLNGSFTEEDLLQVFFSTNKHYSYLPFDKSSSMAKNCQITYIRSDLRDALNERLTLGIQFNEQELQLSKYYAYRGLYLSAGKAVKGEHFLINQNTVIVIPDLMLQPKGDFVKESNEKHPLPLLLASASVPEKGQPHEFKEIRAEGPKINAFDGEGLISPAYAALLFYYLEPDADADAAPTSFQIRMPFIKGMLHRADFQSFLQDEAPDDTDPTVRDCFGIPRKLKDAKIILTTSMFKCFSWLKKDWEQCGKQLGGFADPMEFFFTQFEKYGHRLYISGTNTSLRFNGYEDFNYQFLDTMKLSQKEFSNLINEHFANNWACMKNMYRPRGQSDNKLIAAAQKNHGFFDDDAMYEQMVDDRKKMQLDCGQGILKTRGQHCYLSSDLVALLFYLKDLSEAERNGEELPEDYDFSSHADHLLNEKFYLPGSRLSKNRYYAILRSPHLSRNEELILNPYIPTEENDRYETYFGNLRGILMLPANSFSAMILGGADFDGDFVKLYTNKVIAEAIRSGAYNEHYQRRLPVVMIPNEDSPLARPNDTDFIFLIINTFSNYTGLLSNMAVRFAEAEYSKTEDPHPSYCAITCAITGLEIDSAKHGHHPVADIKFLQKKAAGLGKDSKSFIKLKNELKNMNRYYKVKHGKKGGYTLTATGFQDKTINKPDETSHPLLQLPYAFAVDSTEIIGKANEKQMFFDRILENYRPVKNQRLFRFKSPKGHIDTSWLSEVGLRHTYELIDAWKKINKDRSDYKQKRAALKNIPEYPVLYTLLAAKYDSVNEGVPCPDGSISNQSISEMTELLIAFIRDALAERNSNKRKKEEKALRDQWIFVPAEERPEALYRILFGNTLGTRRLPDPALALVCDFSCKGYLILEYALIIAEKLNTAQKALNTYLNKILDFKETGTCYDALKHYLFYGYRTAKDESNFSEKPDTDEENDDYSADSDSSDSAAEPAENPELPDTVLFTATPEGINNECYRLLREILPKYKIDEANTDEELILKYVWFATYGQEGKDTDFFWKVLPVDLILSGIVEDMD